MRVAIIGGGTIARLFIEHIRRGDLGRARVVAVSGRDGGSRGRALARSFRVPFVTGLKALLAKRPDVVVEAASHEPDAPPPPNVPPLPPKAGSLDEELELLLLGDRQSSS